MAYRELDEAFGAATLYAELPIRPRNGRPGRRKHPSRAVERSVRQKD